MKTEKIKQNRIFKFKMPGKLIMGNGAVENIGQEARKLNAAKVLLITDKGITKAGLIDLVKEPLQKEGLKVGIFNDVEPDPRIEIVSKCTAVIKKDKYELLVGLGGGSSLDIAKASSIMASNSGSIYDYLGIDHIPLPGLPTIMVPTTAGTGSEVTPIAILSDEKASLKKGIVSNYLYPCVAIVDPLMTVGLPPNITAYTGMDALTHAIEAYTSKMAVPFADTFALEAIRLIGVNLRRAVACGTDIEARYNMSLGSLYGGMLLGCVNTAAVHAIAYPIGGVYHIPHGIANTLMLPYVMEFNMISDLKKFNLIAQAMGEDTKRLSLTESAEKAVTAVKKLAGDIGVPRRLRDIGIPREAIPRIAKGAMEVTRLLNNNPRELKMGDVIEICEKAY